jgi:uncharacterized protein Yka (UPF0111/DUF47 family)
MNSNSESGIVRLIDRVFPRMPDFYGRINDQCVLAVEAIEALVDFMETGTPEKADRVRALEKRGDELKARNQAILDKAFATPLDREDIFRAIVGIDHIINYAKTTVREMEVLELQPDPYMLEMAVLLKEGTEALQRGFAMLSTTPADADREAQAARKAERRTEKVYRRAIVELFKVDDLATMLDEKVEGAESRAMMTVIDIFKRREIYRHMSNGADRLAHAGDNLHDIVVKIA